MKLSLGRVAEFVHGSGKFDHGAIAEGYSIDSRALRAGELFFAIKGERLDGHNYVEAALAAGAVAAVIESGQVACYADKSKWIVVADSTLALQHLGAAVRRLWGKKLIAVTGSAGKTTTKECIAHVLGAQFHVLKSLGNLNNHFGLPMQLLRLEPQHEIAVIEMGMSHAGEITTLAQIAAPDEGVVTNVGLAHLESFGTQAGIARAKYELIESLPAGGHAFLNADDAYVSQFGRDFHGRVTLYGIEHPADYRAGNIEWRGVLGSEFDIVGPGFRERVVVPLIGGHNVLNALAAVAVAIEHGVSPRMRRRGWPRSAPATSAAKCARYMAQSSSTIATIPILKHWTAWLRPWRKPRPDGASSSQARCWNWGRARRSCIASVGGRWI